MAHERSTRLDRPIDESRDHVLGNPDAEITLVEYGSYACPTCSIAHEVVVNLLNHFGERMRYVFRHRPITGNKDAERAAQFAEYLCETSGEFWPVHDVLMKRQTFSPDELDRMEAEFGLDPGGELDSSALQRAERRVREDVTSARRSGALVSPTFFINGRRYEGPWDESALAEAMLGSLGHRLQARRLDFVRWGPSAGLLLMTMSILAIILTNSPFGPEFEAFWQAPVGLQFGDGAFVLPALQWVNDGLLTIFFLVVGLEIKREFTVGRLAKLRAAALPIAASLGGMIAPALIYLAVIPAGPLSAGWAVPMATDTAFAIALIVLLGDRVPVGLRVFLTAAVIVDDLAAIAVLALVYSSHIDIWYLAASAILSGALLALNHWDVYRVLPYGLLGILLWICLHEAGLHATLAGVIVAVATPTRPPANLRALTAQAHTVIAAENRYAGEAAMRGGPSEPALRALDVIHNRIESPASRLLRSVEPWSSYGVLPVFALANAGVVLSLDVVEGHTGLMLAIIAGLVLGKPIGITFGAWLAVRLGLAVKPEEYTWRQLAGAGALAGVGFTMSLFIAGQAFPAADFAAAKIAIFTASLLAGALGVAILWARPKERE